MDKGTHNAYFERILPVDPVTAHKIFMEKTWWGGGLPWYLNVLSTTVVRPAKDESGKGAIRQVPGFIHEEILDAELGKFVEYTVSKKRFLPFAYHRGRMNLYPAGPGYTRMVWEINYTPMIHGPLVLPFSFFVLGIMVQDFQNTCVQRSTLPKKRYVNTGSWLAFIVKALVVMYLAFMVSRAMRIPKMKPQPPGEAYITRTNEARANSLNLNEVVSKTSYLIIGGTGFTGSGLVDDLRKRGAKKIRIMGRSMPPSIEYPYSFKKEDHYPIKGVEYIRGDVTDPKALTEAMKDINVVYYVAVSYGNPSFGMVRSHEATEKINVGGMKNVYQAAKDAKTVKQIIYTSSGDTVFTTKPLRYVNETHPYLAYGSDKQYAEGEFAVGDAYARTKIMAEKYLLSMDNKDGIRTLSLRPNGIYGPGEFSNWKKLMDIFFVLGGMPFYFDLNHVTDWSCLYNLVYAHILATHKLAVNPDAVGGKAYFITDDEPTNNAALKVFSPTINAVAGPQAPLIPIPPQLIAPILYGWELLDDFLQKTFGIAFTPFLTWKEFLKVYMTHHYDNSRARKDLDYKPLITTGECQAFITEEIMRRYWGNY